jgi:LytS/YehU family sensor histidine kinase
MLYECNQPLVPLDKELQMLKDYITLEKIRYGNELEMQFDAPSDTNNLMIAPLLLLPFVENCFKHGASHIIYHPWISLHLSTENNVMKMKLVNGKATEYEVPKSLNGIGISNVRRRLELIYPGKYALDIQDEEDVFIVNLKLILEKERKTKEIKSIQLIPADA